MDLSYQTQQRLRGLFKQFNRFMVFIWRLGLGRYGNANPYAGYIMVIRNTGRKTGRSYLTPVNYTISDGDVYCTAGFGQNSDWYQNIRVNPEVEIWLPDSRWKGLAEDVTDSEDAIRLLRQVLIASGFAGPLFGVNPRKMDDSEIASLLGNYRLVRIRRMHPMTGPGGPGDLAWVWPLSTFLLLFFLLRRGGRKRR